MLRIITLALALLAIMVLLGSSIATFFGNETTTEVGSAQSSIPSSSLRSAELVVPTKPSNYSGNDEFREDTTVSLTKLSDEVRLAKQQEFNDFYDDFIGTLSLTEDEADLVKTALSNAYAEAMELAKSGSAAEQDPNFVINSMEAILDPLQIASLEQHMLSTSRNQYIAQYSSQLDADSPKLAADSKAVVMDTMFAEFYALTNPHGAAIAPDSRTFIDQQLEAVSRSRDSLLGSLSSAEFELANQFLSAQEASLNAAKSIFSVRN